MELEKVFLFLLNNSITAGWVILAVIALRLLLRRAPKRLCCLLWALPAVRLALPVSIESVLSLIPSAETVPQSVITGSQISVNTGVPVIDMPLNSYLDERYYEGVTVTAGTALSVTQVLAVIWAAGVAIMLIYSLVSYLRLRRRVAPAVPLRDNIWQSDGIPSPFVLGLFRPRIYLPFALEGEYMADVLTHENTHIRRHDNWWKPLGYLLLCVYWFNPLVWAGYILLGRDMEFACDEAVIAAMDVGGRKSYSLALLSCADQGRPPLMCPPAFGEVGVKERIKNVLNFKRPAVVITAVAVLVLAIAALCLLTNPKSDAAPIAPDESAQPETGVYLRMNMDGVYRLDVYGNSFTGGCVNADGTPFKAGEYILLECLDGKSGEQSFAVVAMDENDQVTDTRTWTLNIAPDQRLELDWQSGMTEAEREAERVASLNELDDQEKEQVRQMAEQELKRWYELGILSNEIKLDGERLQVFINDERDQGGEYFGRVWPESYVMNYSGDRYFVHMAIDMKTGKIFESSIQCNANEGDTPLADREPFTVPASGKDFYYYDLFGQILPENITVDELCTLLNEYWGFDGYTVSGTKYSPYNYDTEAPDGGTAVKSFVDNPFLTVYFDGDQEGVPMYVDVHSFPGSTNVMIGTNHGVG